MVELGAAIGVLAVVVAALVRQVWRLGERVARLEGAGAEKRPRC